jgi:hypothetical protein
MMEIELDEVRSRIEAPVLEGQGHRIRPNRSTLSELH